MTEPIPREIAEMLTMLLYPGIARPFGPTAAADACLIMLINLIADTATSADDADKGAQYYSNQLIKAVAPAWRAKREGVQ